MAYMAQWATFIEGEDLDPIEVARQARARVDNPSNNTWRIVDMSNVDSAVVDLSVPCIVQPGRQQ